MNKTLRAGETLFYEGEPGDCAYIIEKGSLYLSILVNGVQKKISHLSQGALFGEMALIGDSLRSATATACEDSELLVIPGKYFTERMDQADPFIALLLKTSLQRYFEMRTRLERLVSEPNQHSVLFVGDRQLSPMTDGTLTLNTAKQLEAENALKNALETGQLELFYQPIVSLAKQEAIGCESLIRWRHPERGLIPPNDFIGLAETSGLIVPIGTWIIEEAAKASLDFKQRHERFAFVSVNLSGKQFVPGDLLDNIDHIFQKHGIQPRTIKFEITESILMSNPLDTATLLQEMKDRGCTIALDDFGTGYSSFSYLHRFPIDTLKIDQSFISTMRSNPKSYAIVKSLCILAKSLGMSIVAEGVEYIEDQSLLMALGVDYGQGYFYAKPMPRLEFLDYLARH